MSNYPSPPTGGNSVLLARLRAVRKPSSPNMLKRSHGLQDSGYFDNESLEGKADEIRAPTPCNISGLEHLIWDEDPRLEPGKQPFSLNWAAVQDAFVPSKSEMAFLGGKTGWAMTFNDPLSQSLPGPNELNGKEIIRPYLDFIPEIVHPIDKTALIQQRESGLYALLGPEYIGRTGPSYQTSSFLGAEVSTSNSSLSPPDTNPTSWSHLPTSSGQASGRFYPPTSSGLSASCVYAPDWLPKTPNILHTPSSFGQNSGIFHAPPSFGRISTFNSSTQLEVNGIFHASSSFSQSSGSFHKEPPLAQTIGAFHPPPTFDQVNGTFHTQQLFERANSLYHGPPASQVQNDFAGHQAVTLFRPPQLSYPQEALNEVFSQRAGTAGAFLPSRLIAFAPPKFLITAGPHGDPDDAMTTVVFNPNYHGSRTRGSNQDPTIPEHENTALWCMNIPVQASMNEVLDAVRNCGRIYQCHINGASGGHATQAAKIVFCRVAGKVAFQEAANSYPGVFILGQRILVRPNRNRYRENLNPHQTRVLRITGPARYVNHGFLGEYFNTLFRSDVLEISQGPTDTYGYRSMDWTFGSILAQAASAKLAIENEPALRDLITVTYRPDPCE